MKTLIMKLISLVLPCAFVAADMNRIQAGTVTLWLYKHETDNLAAMAASGYFNSWTEHLRQGDQIITSEPDTGSALLNVTSADNASTVTTA